MIIFLNIFINFICLKNIYKWIHNYYHVILTILVCLKLWNIDNSDRK